MKWFHSWNWGDAVPNQQDGEQGEALKSSLFPSSAFWIHMGRGTLQEVKGDGPALSQLLAKPSLALPPMDGKLLLSAY